MKFVLKNGGQILSLSFIYSLAYYSLASTILNFIQSCTEYLLCIPPSVNFAWELRDQEDKCWKLSVSYVNTSIEVFSLGNWGKMLDLSRSREKPSLTLEVVFSRVYGFFFQGGITPSLMRSDTVER